MKRLIVVAVAAVVFACGGSGGGPSTPSVQSPTISSSNTMIYIGQTVQFTATGSGTIRWGGDAPGVATVDVPTGRISGVGNGRVTIWAENEGGRTTRGLRGLPSYGGSWSGTYAVTGCQSTNDLSLIGFCGNFSSGQVANLGLNIIQTDDRVTGGSLAFGTLTGSLNSGSVSENGQLPLTGTTSASSGTITLQNARFDSPTAGTITGSFDESWSITGASGFGILSCTVRNLTRTSGGPSLSFQRPGAVENLTLEQMIRRVLQR
jgi:hypothetical protein